MKYLALDVGTKRTGAAYGDSSDGIVFSLETINHDSFDALLEAITTLIKERNIDELVLGLPLLPSGQPGSQAHIVEEFADMLNEANIAYCYIDERYTTPKTPNIDLNAAAACEILQIKLS